MLVEQKLTDLGFPLPVAPGPTASYVQAVRSGNLVFLSGQFPYVAGRLAYTGRLGRELTLDDGKRAAEICVLNALASIRQVIGDLDGVSRVVKMLGFVNSTPDFSQQGRVTEAASRILLEAFGDCGAHTRSSIGVTNLPDDAPVSIDITIEITTR